MKDYKQIKEEVEVQNQLDEGFRDSLKELENINPNESEVSYIEVNENQHEINEEVGISITLIFSLILSTPTIIKGIVKAIGWVVNKIRKLFNKDEKEFDAVEKIVEFTEKWHHKYIMVVKQLLEKSGIFKKAGVEEDEKKEMAAEVVFYTIVFGFVVQGGWATGEKIIKTVETGETKYIQQKSLKAAITALKSKEVAEFISKFSSKAA